LRIAGRTPIAFAAVLSCGAALAEALPKTATPLDSEAVVKIYSGRTALWKDADVYFAPDGTAKGVLGKPKITGVSMGTWAVGGNEICIYAFRRNEGATFRDCYRYWRDGTRILTLWSSHGDGSAVDEKDGYYAGEEDKMKSGDRVSEKYSAAGGW
jgi:hypothetical protein